MSHQTMGQRSSRETVSGRDGVSGQKALAPKRQRKRGADQARLEPFIGRWRIEGRNAAAAPMGSSDRVTGEVSYEWLPGRFFVLCRWDRLFGADRQHHTGFGVIGHEPDEASYFVHNFDNLGYARRYRLDLRDRTWTFAGPWERASLAFSADGRSFTERWEVAADGNKWQSLCELTATKLD
jgi:hypothetical protein